MLEKARELIRSYINKDDRVMLALSGGKDSMCLLYLLIESGVVRKENICALHVNHCIRGGQADSDSEFVERYCKDNGIGIIIERVDVPSLSKKSGRSIETEAREQRRRLYKKLIEDKQADKVLLAHHMDDQAETVLMHIFRGAGISGLIGMKVIDGHMFRPLLTTSRAEIEEYITAYNIPFVTDESNDLIEYNRNYIRHEILPRIKTRWSGVSNSLQKLSSLAKENEQLLDSFIKQELILTDKAESGTVRLSVECFESGHLLTRYIFKALTAINANVDIEAKHIDIIKVLALGRNGARAELKNGLRAYKEYDYVTFERTNQASQEEMEFRRGTFRFMDKMLSIEPHSVEIVEGELIFDLDKIPSDSVIRTRREGDFFKAYGGNTKKLKKYLIDKKVPLRIRDTIPCVCSGSEVLVIFGMEISENVKLSGSSANAALAKIIIS